MPTAESVKAKLQGIIDKSNATTGETDTTVTEAVDRLIEGYGSGGDSMAIARSIADGSITEYVDDEIEKIKDNAFYACNSLKSISLAKAKTIGISAFQNTLLHSVDLPSVTMIKANAFSKCLSLTSIAFENATTIRYGAFNNCTKLEKIYLPAATDIAPYSFRECSALKRVCLPKYTGTSSSCIFFECTSLTSVDLEVATSVGTQLFQDCTSLTTVILRKSDSICTLVNTNAFTNTPIADGTGYVYVPSALVEDYKAATNWSTYADQIRAIEDYPEITAEEESE